MQPYSDWLCISEEWQQRKERLPGNYSFIVEAFQTIIPLLIFYLLSCRTHLIHMFIKHVYIHGSVLLAVIMLKELWIYSIKTYESTAEGKRWVRQQMNQSWKLRKFAKILNKTKVPLVSLRNPTIKNWDTGLFSQLFSLLFIFYIFLLNVKYCNWITALVGFFQQNSRFRLFAVSFKSNRERAWRQKLST